MCNNMNVMENQSLECNVIVEYFSKEGWILRKANFKGCSLRLTRNEYREMFLEVIGNNKNKGFLRNLLKNVTIHKKFMSEGKATIKFENDKLNVMISNAPPSQLYSFLKLLTIKLISGGDENTVTYKLLSSRLCSLEDISPLTEKDFEKAKAKLDYSEKTPTGVTKTLKRPLDDMREIEAKKNCLLPINEQNLVEEQKEILEAAESGQNIFFTGGAGTGKSHLLRQIIFIFPPEGTFATASTRVAASQLRGTTLHQFAGIGTGEGTIKECIALASRPNVRAIWRKCQHLIIDEISMVPGDFFEKLEHVARVVRKNNKPFGGIQLILCGDFFQLPPVGKNAVFCFETDAWEKCVTRCFELTQIHRQTDPRFVQILRNIRLGIVTDWIHEEILKTSEQNIEKNGILPTTLCTHTSEAAAINKIKLEELEGGAKVYTAIDDPPLLTDFIDKHHPVQSTVVLKVGAQVMLTKNLNFSKGVVNGARGVILKFDPADKLPLVKFNSTEYKVQREKFVMKLANGMILTRIQIPLNLAWAFSIHKSQGLTLDCVELSLTHVFGAGHAYVALSRVRSLDCLRVIDFDPSQVWANKQVLDYYKKFQQTLEDFKLLNKL